MRSRRTSRHRRTTRETIREQYERVVDHCDHLRGGGVDLVGESEGTMTEQAVPKNVVQGVPEPPQEDTQDPDATEPHEDD